MKFIPKPKDLLKLDFAEKAAAFNLITSINDRLAKEFKGDPVQMERPRVSNKILAYVISSLKEAGWLTTRLEKPTKKKEVLVISI